MLIKNLRMENFRQFLGITEIDFSCDSKKNVTVILGDNTYGKTTLLQAFNWCFYGKVNFGKNAEDLLNYELVQNIQRSQNKVINVEVKITLLHSELEYVITRTKTYTRIDDKIYTEKPVISVSYKKADGQTESIPGSRIADTINNILPEDLSTYFFFDTERINSISTEKRNVAEAVKGLLGLSMIESASKHLGTRTKKGTLIYKLYRSMDLDGDSKAHEALERVQNAESEREKIADQLEECRAQIKKYEDRKEEINNILRVNQTTAELQKTKEDFESKVKSEQKRLAETTELYFKEFSARALAFFAKPLLASANEVLKQGNVDSKGVRDLTRTTIEEIIKRGRCICGQEIHEGNEAYKHLVEELKYVPPESIGNIVQYYREKLDTFSDSADLTYSSLRDRFKNILDSEERIHIWEEQIEKISRQISGKENMHQYEQELADIQTRLKALNEKRDSLNQKDGEQKKIIEQDQKFIDSHTAVSAKNEQTRELIEYAEAIKKWLDNRYDEKEIAIREDLTAKVNEIFKRMYHGVRRIVIDSKYNVELIATIDDQEIAAGESEGSNRVKNFAFIAGLVALAKNKVVTNLSDKNFNLSSEPYPLVMDAPFSNADEKHTANISKVLPEIAEQIIMFVMQKDWEYAAKVMNDRVGKMYQLEKITETHTRIV